MSCETARYEYRLMPGCRWSLRNLRPRCTAPQFATGGSTGARGLGEVVLTINRPNTCLERICFIGFVLSSLRIMYMPLPWDLPCGDALRKGEAGRSYSKLHLGA